MRLSLAFASCFFLSSCIDNPPIEPETGGSNPGGSNQGGSTTISGGGTGGMGNGTTTTSTTGGGAPCPANVTCVTSFPFSDQRDTSQEGSDVIPTYDCAPNTDEGGPEIVYRVTIPSDGFLSAAVYDGAGTDIDVHILTDFDPDEPAGTTCVDRGDRQARADVKAGYAWIIADTWVNSSGPLTGNYKIDIGFIPVSSGPCELETGTLARVGDKGDSLSMPATGPVVLEDHLVTQSEPAPFPSTNTDELADHYALSQAATGLVMYRVKPWAPIEGGDFFGHGIGDPARFPVKDEGWYVNMYWTPAARPPRGTRMILRHPDDPSRAVVVAAGYETGPSDLSAIGGTTEETHFYLGTGHRSELTLGFAADQSLALGPRHCTD